MVQKFIRKITFVLVRIKIEANFIHNRAQILIGEVVFEEVWRCQEHGWVRNELNVHFFFSCDHATVVMCVDQVVHDRQTRSAGGATRDEDVGRIGKIPNDPL